MVLLESLAGRVGMAERIVEAIAGSSFPDVNPDDLTSHWLSDVALTASMALGKRARHISSAGEC